MKYKVKAIMNFNDLEENTHRNVGDVFEVNERRRDYLLKHNAIEVIEEDKNETIEMEVSFDSEQAIDKVKEIAENGGTEEEAIEEVEKIIEDTIQIRPKSNKNKKSSKK